MKDLIFITAYCETQKQEELLERCINSVMKCGLHIALLSHSHIPFHIQKKCNYYFYDYNNDVSGDHNLLGHFTFHFGDRRIQSRFFNKKFYGFAIYRMFSMASQIATNFGYENVHHIEYDCELLDENLIFENIESLKEYDSVISTDTGDKNGWLYGSFKSFRVKSLPDKFKNYDRDFIDSEMRKLDQTHLEFLTKKILIESGNVLFKNEPPKDRFIKGNINEHRGLHFTLYYNPEDGTLNIFYNALELVKSEEITVIINKEKVVKIITKSGFWTTRILDQFNEITHVRVDNNNKVIYEVSFDNEFREIFKNKSYILNNEK
jgi:hypothetical protein